jgi:hypothetical protein
MPVGLQRARWFLETARDATLEFADDVHQKTGIAPGPVVLQFPASLFDELLVDIEHGERELQAAEAELRKVRRRAAIAYGVYVGAFIVSLLAVWGIK